MNKKKSQKEGSEGGRERGKNRKFILKWSFNRLHVDIPSKRLKMLIVLCIFISSVQSFSHIWLFATPWTEAHQASMPFTNSQSLLKLMSIKPVMISSHLILCHSLLFLHSVFPNIRVFSSEFVLHIRWPNIGVSTSASVLPANIQNWLPLGLTGLIPIRRE